ncbi:hypothetical protein MMC26_003394 [Xylographa opegraphella]|nr:hypothetical protein [Xylographa opegraphella]
MANKMPLSPPAANGLVPDSQGDLTPNLQRTPFTHPSAASHDPPRTTLTPEQETKYNSVLNTVSSWTTIPNTSATKAPTLPITDAERMWLTRECLLRYLRASKWSVPDAIRRLLETLTWRREWGLVEHTADYISIENETGKQLILGYDIDARPCLYLNPSKQNTEKGPRQLQHLVFMLERTIDLMGPGQETLALLINFQQMSSGQSPSIAQGRQTMNILQNHYPERLGRACVINIPWFFWVFYKTISPFIDPTTKQKLKFNEPISLHVPPEQLLKTHGGEVEFSYEHSVYWPALNQLAGERKKKQEERWVNGGKRLGESEVYLKGGDEKSIGESKLDNVDTVTEKLQELQSTEKTIQQPFETQ